jgi:hypothetical protein
MAGLLGNMGAAPMPQQGGLLGSSGQISDEQGKQMAMQLASSPTPEMAMKIASSLSASGSQELIGIAKFLSDNANDKQALMHLAQSVLGQ